MDAPEKEEGAQNGILLRQILLRQILLRKAAKKIEKETDVRIPRV